MRVVSVRRLVAPYTALYGYTLKLEQAPLDLEPAAVLNRLPPLPTSRWHGTMIGTGLAPLAAPTARNPRGARNRGG